MNITQEGLVHILELDSVSELAALPEPQYPGNVREFHSLKAGTSYMSSASWAGGSVAEINEVLKYGWPEGLERVERLANELRSHVEAPKSYRRRPQWREDGDEPSWEREQHGHTAIWRSSRRDTMRGPAIIQIVAAWGGLGYLRAEQLQWNGVALAVLCMLMEEAGYRVGASLVNSSSFGFGKYTQTVIQVKHPSMPLDLASMVPAICHPGVFRNHGFMTKLVAAQFDASSMGGTRQILDIPRTSLIREDAIVLNHAYSEAEAKVVVESVLDQFKSKS